MTLRSNMMRATGLFVTLGLAAACSAGPGTTGTNEPTTGQAAASTVDKEFTGHIIPLPGKQFASREDLKSEPFANSCNLKYLGGQVIHEVSVVSVLWGSLTDPNTKSQLPAFYKDVTASTYMETLKQYHTTKHTGGTDQTIIKGSYDKQVEITPSVCPGTTACTVTDVQIQAELNAQITDGNLPAPKYDSEGYVKTLYVFEFPANDTISLTIDGTTSESCSSFCGYHNFANLTRTGKVQPYGVIPAFASGECSQTCSETPPASLGDLTSVHSHELAEAITDTNVTIVNTYVKPSAWGGACGEIGDICNFEETTANLNGTTWTVQEIWSNKSEACVANGT